MSDALDKVWVWIGGRLGVMPRWAYEASILSECVNAYDSEQDALNAMEEANGDRAREA